jgi:hypothetical protein
VCLPLLSLIVWYLTGDICLPSVRADRVLGLITHERRA